MEGFPRDVQTIILRMIAGTEQPAFLFHLFCTNRMFRSWVTRFVWDYCVPASRIYGMIRKCFGLLHFEEAELVEWDIIGKLKVQWEKRPARFVAFCMCAHAWEGGVYINRGLLPQTLIARRVPADKLFCPRNSVLAKLRTLRSKRAVRDVCRREIDKYEKFVASHRDSMERAQIRLDANRAKRGPLEEQVQELEAYMSQPSTKKSKSVKKST